MKNAIIGATGLIGNRLSKLIEADHYNSKNINELKSGYDCVFVCAPSAQKWCANQNATTDAQNIKELVDKINASNPKKIIHFSTIDVYGAIDHNGLANEKTIPSPDCPYGKNRLDMENAWTAKSTIIRLPGLYGIDLKKNFLFDLKNKTDFYKNSCMNSSFQWFDLDKLSELIAPEKFCGYIENEKKIVLNVTTEPITNHEIVNAVGADSCAGTNAVHYNIKSLFGYFGSKEENLKQICEYLNAK